ncbi:MAG TPA: MBL fold metallo-hydrolase [Candidatus Limnocylindrales bacterium]|nr:MBL fold metallo-hydrolase [Candidatus Limnocylindrales bacterium]
MTDAKPDGGASADGNMRVRLWGTRGSIASAGPDTVAYGGNTSCVEVEGRDGTIVILDAGTGVRRVGDTYHEPRRLDILLTHLHMDHIQGLGFFAPLFQKDFEVHVWGPPSTTQDLRTRLTRYLSPPLFPVRLRDVAARVELHDVPTGDFNIGGLEVSAQTVIHPGQTVGYRVCDKTSTMTYLPDHEPALGSALSSNGNGATAVGEWTSGHDLSRDTDLLLHDAQYTADEYDQRVGWGHSQIGDAVALAALAGATKLVTFHHDPAHDDAELDMMLAEAQAAAPDGLEVLPGREGMTFHI